MQRITIGSIYAIPLRDNTFAYAKQFKDATIAIYKYRSKTLEKKPLLNDIDFFVAVYDDVLKSGIWPKIDNLQFESEDDAWPPPRYIQDKLNPDSYSIYYKGIIQKAAKEQCIGLEAAMVWDKEHIIDRLEGKDTWTKICRE